MLIDEAGVAPVPDCFNRAANKRLGICHRHLPSAPSAESAMLTRPGAGRPGAASAFLLWISMQEHRADTNSIRLSSSRQIEWFPKRARYGSISWVIRTAPNVVLRRRV